MTARPFNVLGVQQIALGSRDRRALRTLWVDCLGLTPASTYTSAVENVDEEILSVGLGLGRVEVDLMQPVDEAARPTIHEPALHHVGLWIDALHSAVAGVARRAAHAGGHSARRNGPRRLLHSSQTVGAFSHLWQRHADRAGPGTARPDRRVPRRGRCDESAHFQPSISSVTAALASILPFIT
jgi:Glyoxalase/Bleomycin resistance protein/Dioxygenase superfamily